MDRGKRSSPRGNGVILFTNRKNLIIYKVEIVYIFTFGFISHGETVNFSENFTKFFNKVGNENLKWQQTSGTAGLFQWVASSVWYV